VLRRPPLLPEYAGALFSLLSRQLPNPVQILTLLAGDDPDAQHQRAGIHAAPIDLVNQAALAGLHQAQGLVDARTATSAALAA